MRTDLVCDWSKAAFWLANALLLLFDVHCKILENRCIYIYIYMYAHPTCTCALAMVGAQCAARRLARTIIVLATISNNDNTTTLDKPDLSSLKVFSSLEGSYFLLSMSSSASINTMHSVNEVSAWRWWIGYIQSSLNIMSKSSSCEWECSRMQVEYITCSVCKEYH